MDRVPRSEIKSSMHRNDSLSTGIGTRKAVNRRLVQAKKDAERSAVAVQSRIKLLGVEEKRMQKKID